MRTTDSNHQLPIAPNRLDQQFSVSRPDVVWTSDITYIWTQEGWLYLAIVLDLFSRKIVGWSMAPYLERTLVIDALQMAVATRNPSEGLIHHSDQGSQYASHDYQKLLRKNKMVASMSRRGNCYDNAPAGSWFATLKRELVYRRNYTPWAEAKQDIFEYIEVWRPPRGTIGRESIQLLVTEARSLTNNNGKNLPLWLLNQLSTKMGKTHIAIMSLIVLYDSIIHLTPLYYIVYFFLGLLVGRIFSITQKVEGRSDSGELTLISSRWNVLLVLVLILPRFVVGIWLIEEMHVVWPTDALYLFFIGLYRSKWKSIVDQIDERVYQLFADYKS